LCTIPSSQGERERDPDEAVQQAHENRGQVAGSGHVSSEVFAVLEINAQSLVGKVNKLASLVSEITPGLIFIET
jgi:hypothetical protein